MARSIAFIDSEVGINDKKIHDLVQILHRHRQRRAGLTVVVRSALLVRRKYRYIPSASLSVLPALFSEAVWR